MTKAGIESISRENRIFEPPAEFSKNARIDSMEAYRALYDRSIEEPEAFWAEQARELHWFKQPEQVLDWKPPHARWFADGLTNVAYNCLDRHLQGPRRHKAAIIWEGEPGDQRVLTYQQLWRETCRFANGLKRLGVKAGDRVAIYMGMVPEAAIAMLGCARIGAVHSVIFGGFAADAIRDRVNDAEATVVITQDGAYRRGQVVPLKEQVDRALEGCPTVKHTVVLERTGTDINMKEGRDHDWHALLSGENGDCPATELESVPSPI